MSRKCDSVDKSQNANHVRVGLGQQEKMHSREITCRNCAWTRKNEFLQSDFHIPLISELRQFVNSLEEEGLCSKWMYSSILILPLKKGGRDLSHWGKENWCVNICISYRWNYVEYYGSAAITCCFLLCGMVDLKVKFLNARRCCMVLQWFEN